MEFKRVIDPIMRRSDGRVVDVFFELFTLLSSLEKDIQVSAFQYICENIKDVDYTEDNRIAIKKYYTAEQIKKYIPRIKERFTNEMTAILYDASKNKLSSEEFYKKIWLLINSNKICKNKREKALATFFFVDSDLIPYRAVGQGISMTDDEYSSIIDSLDTDLVKDMGLIMQIEYKQKTNRASLLVEKLDSLNTLEEKAVFLSMILQKAEDNIKQEIRESIDNL